MILSDDLNGVLSYSAYTENTLHSGKDVCTADLQLTGLDLYSQENLLLFVCNQTTEKTVKLETVP